VGIREVDEKIWLVSFLDFDFGYFDEAEGRVELGPNPFAAKVLPMCSERTEVVLVPQRGFEPLTHALRIRGSLPRPKSINNLRTRSTVYVREHQ
jgi:hypothetical protein